MRLRKTWKMHVKEEGIMIGVCRKYLSCRSKLCLGVNKIATRVWYLWPPSVGWHTLALKHWYLSLRVLPFLFGDA